MISINIINANNGWEVLVVGASNSGFPEKFVFRNLQEIATWLGGVREPVNTPIPSAILQDILFPKQEPIPGLQGMNHPIIPPEVLYKEHNDLASKI